MTQSSDTIVFQLRGQDSDGGDLALHVFIAHLQKLSKMLRKVRDDIVGDSSVRYLVSQLSHSSPSTIGVTATQTKPRSTTHLRVIGETFSGLESIGVRGVVPEYYTNDVIESFREFVGYTNRNSAGGVLSVNGASLEINIDFEAKLRQAVGRSLYEMGSVTGHLVQFNALGAARQFTIEPTDGSPTVRCKFPSRLIDDAAASVLSLVEVSGRLAFHPGQRHPYVLVASSIDTIRPRSREASATLGELRGIAASQADDGDVMDLIAEIRAEWDRD